MTKSQLKQDTLLDRLPQGDTSPQDIMGKHGLRNPQKCGSDQRLPRILQ